MLNDSMYFHLGNGKRDTYMWLDKAGVIRTYFICDVCPGDETLGLFEVRNDTLFIDHRIRFMYNPHWARVTDTTYDRCSWRDTLVYVKHKEHRYLVPNPDHFKRMTELCESEGVVCDLEWYFLRQVARKD